MRPRGRRWQVLLRQNPPGANQAGEETKMAKLRFLALKSENRRYHLTYRTRLRAGPGWMVEDFEAFFGLCSVQIKETDEHFSSAQDPLLPSIFTSGLCQTVMWVCFIKQLRPFPSATATNLRSPA